MLSYNKRAIGVTIGWIFIGMGTIVYYDSKKVMKDDVIKK